MNCYPAKNLVWPLLFVLSLMAGWGCSDPAPPSPSSSNSEKALKSEVSTVEQTWSLKGIPEIEAALSLADSLNLHLSGFDSLSRRIEEDRVDIWTSNARAQIVLALAYKEERKFRDAIEHIEVAIRLRPEVSDAHCVLGDVLYELALMNMVVKGEYRQKELLLFEPGETSRQLFRRAVDSYNLAAKILSESLTRKEEGTTIEVCDMSMEYRLSRMQRASLYAGGQAPEDTAYTEDQAKAIVWLVTLSRDSSGNRNSFEELAEEKTSWLVSMVMASDRDDKTLLKGLIELQSASVRYIRYCVERTPSNLYVLERERLVKKIKQALGESGIRIESTSLGRLAADDCPGRAAWGEIEREIMEKALGHGKRAFVNFFRLPGVLIAIEAGLIAPSGPVISSNRLSLAGVMSTLPAQLILNEGLELELRRLVKAVEEAQSQEQWLLLKPRLDSWVEKVVEYSLKPPEATEEAQPTTRAERHDVDFWIRKGVEAETAGNPTEALALYEKALQLEPYSYVANFDKGNALIALERYPDAIEAYDRAIAVRLSSAEALMNRENARLRSFGITWPNVKAARRFLEHDIRETSRKNRLGASLLLLVECTKKNEEACEILKNEIERDPKVESDFQTLDYTMGR